MTDKKRDEIESNINALAIITQKLNDEEFERFLEQAKTDFGEYNDEEQNYIVEMMKKYRDKVKSK